MNKFLFSLLGMFVLLNPAIAESPSTSLLHVTGDNFQEEVIESSQPVVVDVYADWCGPCRLLAPIFADLEAELGGSFKFVKLDVDQEREISRQYQISAIPTILFFRDGELVGRHTGFMNKKEFRSKIIEILGEPGENAEAAGL